MKTKIALSLLVAALVAVPRQAQGQGVGFAQRGFAVGQYPIGVAVGDFNGDGNLDVAVANFADNTLSVLLGDGKGGLSAKVDYPTGTGPVAVAVGDFDGDGKLDIAVACKQANVVSVLLGKGDGTFGTKSDYPTGNNPKGIAAGDFNGDGKMDLVTANYNADTVSVLLGQGNGSFGARTDFATGSQPFAVVVDDFNGDGKLDLATANNGAGTVSILLGTGDGSFGTKTDFLTDLHPVSLASADFRNQMKRDLVTVNATNSTASLLLGRGDGTFDPRTDLGVDTGPIAVTAADFNADGKMDFASVAGYPCSFYYYCDEGALSLRLGDGAGGFSAVSLPLPTFDPAPGGMAQGDFNGDGRVDLAVTDPNSNVVWILLQAANGTVNGPGALAFSNFQIIGTTSAPQTVTVSSNGSFPLQISTVTLGGTNASEFQIVADSCSGTSLPAGNGCAVSLDFSPASTGIKLATISYKSNSGQPLSDVSVNGAGVLNAPVAAFSPTEMQFAPQFIGTTSGILTAYLSNAGGVTMNYTSVAVGGPNSTDFMLGSGGVAPCSLSGGSLAPGAKCSLGLVFTPSAAENRSATVTVTDDATGSPHTLALSGQGVSAFQLVAASGQPTTQTIHPGQGAKFNFSISNSSGAAGMISFTCSGAPPAGRCDVTPMEISGLNANPQLQLSVVTGARGELLPQFRRLNPASKWPARPTSIALLLLLLGVCLLGGISRRLTGSWGAGTATQRRGYAGAVIALLIVLTAGTLFSACGGTASSSGNGGTPPGTYPITVTGTAGTVTETIQFAVEVK